MLRSQLGPDLYRECIRTYVQRHQFGNTVTEDLNRVLEEISGRSWDQFLDQWIYHGGYPDLEIRYDWDEVAGAAHVTIKQEQESNDQVLLFSLPLKIQFKGKNYTVDQPLRIDERENTFTVMLPGRPEVVLADPDVELLAKITLNRPQSMVESMLQDQDALSARLEAAELLGKRQDNRAVGLLGTALKEDSHYGVRIQASKSLRNIHTHAALQALLDGQSQPDARARLQVVRDIGVFYREEALAALLNVVENESNPAIVASALEGLAGHRGEKVTASIKQQLHHQSYENEICRAAISAARKHRDPAIIGAILERLQGEQLETSTRSTALETLAVLASEGTQEEDVLSLLLDHVENPSERIQQAALRGLGTLGNEKALPVLERYTTGKAKETAQSAIKAIRDRRPVSPELQQLREEVQNLRREQEELREKIK
jgi:aminopeptidase N